MSSIDPIEVPEDLPEAKLNELHRLERLDGAEAIKHRSTGQMDSCDDCRAILRLIRHVAAGGTTPMIEMVEQVAIKLAERSMVPNLWGHMAANGRNALRTQAVEIVLIVNPALSLQED